MDDYIIIGLMALASAAAFSVLLRRRPSWGLTLIAVAAVLGPAYGGLLDLPPVVRTLLLRADNALILVAVVCAALNGSSGKRLGPGLPTAFYTSFGLFIGTGVLSAMTSGYGELGPGVAGTWLAAKFAILIVSVRLLIQTQREYDHLVRNCIFLGVLVAFGGVAQMLNAQMFADLTGLHATSSYRGGLLAVRSLTAHPGFYSGIVSVAFALLLVRETDSGRPLRKRSLLLGMAALLSLRLKAVLNLCALLGGVVLSRHRQLVKRAGLAVLLPALLIGMALSVGPSVYEEPIGALFGKHLDPPRLMLTKASMSIASDRFPLGVGFGRFGTGPSLSPYSEVYDDYGLSWRWGLSRANGAFAADTSWPAVLGETGLLGLVLLVVAYITLLIDAKRFPRIGGSVGPYALLALLMSESLGGPGLFDTVILLGVAIGLWKPPVAIQPSQYQAGAPARIPSGTP